jgi:hypothetical protein
MDHPFREGTASVALATELILVPALLVEQEDLAVVAQEKLVLVVFFYFFSPLFLRYRY